MNHTVPTPPGGRRRPQLLLYLTHADHPHRDPACATLAWLAEAEGCLFECYFDSPHSGIHFGGGHPGWYRSDDLRGSTIIGGRHIEQLHRVLEEFDCEAACLGPTMWQPVLERSAVPIRSTAADVATFYREVFKGGGQSLPDELLVVGDGGRPQGVALTPYAFPEIVGRRVLAVADGDVAAVRDLVGSGLSASGIWLSADRYASWSCEGTPLARGAPHPAAGSVAEQTSWMAERWPSQPGRPYLLGDPELVGRWAPTAIREGWSPLYGIPQTDVIARMAPAIGEAEVVYGRQHHDSDFFHLSRLGTGFQVIDPGSPPFPVLSRAPRLWPAPPDAASEPSDGELHQWASERRVLVSLLFWTGMIRELQNVAPVVDMLGLTGLRAGLVVTTETFRFMEGTPLWMVNVPSASGGLFPNVELLLTDSGSGVLVAAEAPPEKFARALQRSVAELGESLGDPALGPKGWWAHLDGRLSAGRRPKISTFPDRPRVRLRYEPRQRELAAPTASQFEGRPGLRSRLRDSPLGRYFAPLRPYESQRPGTPEPHVLHAVSEAGFRYAVTKSAYGFQPRAAVGPGGLTVLNHTAGRWDGWSPFFTVNALADLRQAERKLLGRGRPGWLLGALDTCLWAFTGPVWHRGTDLFALSDWVAAGGSDGRLLNVTPATIARYARILISRGEVDPLALGPTPLD